MNIIITGPPGSGKGTQAKMLAEKLGIPHIGTGEVFRQEISKKTELGKKIEEIMKTGKLVSDEITIEVVKKRLAEDDCKNGWILDGFPRTIEQAKALDEFAKVEFVIDFSVTDEVSVERISQRRDCAKCGAIFGLAQGKPEKCTVCGGEVAPRADQDPEVVKKRLEVYHKKTKPLSDYYKPKNVLYTIDGNRPVQDVFNELQKVVG